MKITGNNPHSKDQILELLQEQKAKIKPGPIKDFMGADYSRGKLDPNHDPTRFSGGQPVKLYYDEDTRVGVDIHTLSDNSKQHRVETRKFDTYEYTGSALALQPHVSNLYSLPEELQSNNSGRTPDFTKDPNIIHYEFENTMPLSDLADYMGASVESRRNELGRFFFTADFDFLYDSAKEYAKIESHQDYDLDPTKSYDFVSSVMSFLDGDNRSSEEWNELKADMKGVAREIAERMKNGQSTDLESLGSTLTIKGAEFTMSEIKQLQEDTKFFASFSPVTGEQQASYANLGLAKTAGNLIADKWGNKSEEFSNTLKSALSRTVDEFSAVLQKRVVTSSPFYDKTAVNTGLKTEKMFAGIDTSNRETVEKSYQDIRGSFSNMLDDYIKTMAGLADSKGVTLSAVDRQFNKILNYIYS